MALDFHNTWISFWGAFQLSIVDEFTRECLALKVSRSITSEDVIDTLAELFAMYGVPRHIRSDNGPEFVAKSLRGWLERIGVGAL